MSGDDPLIGSTLADRYRVELLIGVGAMGRVYRAEHIHMRKTVALKVLHPQLMKIPDIVQRFELEAQTAAQVQHPHVARATDFGKLADGTFYLALEYVEGMPLSHVIRDGPLPPLRVLDIALQVVSALGAAHELGIVHRDLKPDNLLLVTSSEHDFIKVLDFGIAKAELRTSRADRPQTLAGMVYGTPEYMAPEQALAQPVDGRADFYALGVVLYELLTARRPYLGPSASLLGQQLSKPIPKMSDVADVRIPQALEALVVEMLATDPQKRPPNTQVLTERLAALDMAQERSSSVEGRAAAEPDSARTYANLGPAEAGPSASRSKPRSTRAVLMIVAFAALGVGGAVVSVSSLRVAHAPVPAATVLVSPPPALDETEPDIEVSSELEAKIRLARQTGIDALVQLGREHPSEGTIQAELALEFARIKRYQQALDAVRAALALDPKLNDNRKVAGALFRAAQSADVRAASFRLLEGPMGAAGVSIIYDLAHTEGIQPRVRADAEQLLAKPEVREAASPPLRLLLDLEIAKSCEDVATLVRRAGLVGDKRVLPKLQALNRTTGCDPKDQGDCYPCLRADHSLADAISTITQRSTLSDGTLSQ